MRNHSQSGTCPRGAVRVAVLAPIGALMPIDLMPGIDDPSGHLLPQQPFHAAAFWFTKSKFGPKSKFAPRFFTSRYQCMVHAAGGERDRDLAEPEKKSPDQNQLHAPARPPFSIEVYYSIHAATYSASRPLTQQQQLPVITRFADCGEVRTAAFVR